MAAPLQSAEFVPSLKHSLVHNAVARLIVSKHQDDAPRYTQYHAIASGENVQVPYTVTTAKPLGSTAVKLLVPGFGATKSAYLPLAYSLADRGITAVTYKPSRSIHDMRHPQNLLADEAVAVAEDLYNRFGISEIDEAGHSRGGPAAVKAAEKVNRRDKGVRVRELELVQAAGVTNHNIGSLGLHVPQVWAESMKAAAMHPELMAESLVHFYVNLPRTLSVFSCTKSI
jgi:pimeloyl-ACP methyl ester carboxylesterase